MGRPVTGMGAGARWVAGRNTKIGPWHIQRHLSKSTAEDWHELRDTENDAVIFMTLFRDRSRQEAIAPSTG